MSSGDSSIEKQTLKKLVRLEKAIEGLLSEGVPNDYLEGLIEEFEQIVDGFEKDNDDVEKGYTDKAVQFMTRFGKLQKSRENSQSLFPKKVKQHNGQVMSFLGFWKLFELNVMSQPIDEATKLGLLLNAVHDSDTTAIAACSTIEEARMYLERKYVAKSVIRQLFQNKIGPLSVKNETDSDGLMLMMKLAAELNLLVEPKKDKMLTFELFTHLIDRLPLSVRDEYFLSCINLDKDIQKDMNVFVEFLEKKIDRLQALQKVPIQA
ncbi:hypothetical protein TYRP_007682 [Tyrophagus putrescentiae]|nr:hypothetical protein TYRP_007682 [Tyrophagus putrescentiae]